jgi:hypothetical protein
VLTQCLDFRVFGYLCGDLFACSIPSPNDNIHLINIRCIQTRIINVKALVLQKSLSHCLEFIHVMADAKHSLYVKR